MFLAIQFPFADAREFLDDSGGRLSRPAWPLVSPGKDFLRSSGLIRPRRRGGVSDWAGEETFSDAKRALRFEDQLGAKWFCLGSSSGNFKCAFRRFHSQGIVARFEVGLRFSAARAVDDSILPLLREVLAMPVVVPGIDTGTQSLLTVQLAHAGERLAKHFLVSTTDHKRIPLNGMRQAWWFTCGNPGVLVEYFGDLKLPPHSRHVLEIPDAGISLSHSWLNVGKQRCSVWFMHNSDFDRNAARRLRIHLTRLHSERECLKSILLHIKEGSKVKLDKDSPCSDKLQHYLKDAVNLLQRPKFMGLQQSAMLDAAQEALGVAFADETASLEWMRRQIASLVDGYVRRAQNTATIVNNIQGNLMSTNIQMGNVSVSGDFSVVTAENIIESYNRIGNAAVRDDLKQRLQDLSIQVAILTKELPRENAETASRDLNTLTAEATSAKPRRETCEVSAKGLIEAARTVAKMIGPISVAVKGVLALLGT